MKLCVNCKYIMNLGPDIAPFCEKTEYVDPVTGTPKFYTCSWARTAGSSCGIAARHHEQALPPILTQRWWHWLGYNKNRI